MFKVLFRAPSTISALLSRIPEIALHEILKVDVCFSLQLPRDWLQEKEAAAPSSGEAEEPLNALYQTHIHLPNVNCSSCICASDASGASVFVLLNFLSRVMSGAISTGYLSELNLTSQHLKPPPDTKYMRIHEVTAQTHKLHVCLPVFCTGSKPLSRSLKGSVSPACSCSPKDRDSSWLLLLMVLQNCFFLLLLRANYWKVSGSDAAFSGGHVVDFFFLVQFKVPILEISVLQRGFLALSLLEEYLVGYLKDPLHAAPRTGIFTPRHTCGLRLCREALNSNRFAAFFFIIIYWGFWKTSASFHHNYPGKTQTFSGKTTP